jgi:hypothetical protein
MKGIATTMAVLLASALALAAQPSFAQGPGCVPPAYLLHSDAKLDKTAAAVKTNRKLNVLLIGSYSSTLPGPDGAAIAYPKRLEARLGEVLSGVTVNLTTELFPKKTAEELVEEIGKLVAAQKPDLVIWQTGTVDALRSAGPDEFRTALDESLDAIKNAGADTILVNLQYSPRTETMISATPYLDAIRAAAQQYEVPVFDRFGLMRYWSETGEFDFFGNTRGSGMAKRVHECLGRALATLLIEAAKINPAELRIQR